MGSGEIWGNNSYYTQTWCPGHLLPSTYDFRFSRTIYAPLQFLFFLCFMFVYGKIKDAIIVSKLKHSMQASLVSGATNFDKIH